MERMEKQTAVDWLLENLITEPYSETDFEHNSNCWDKAKEMEKEQIEDAWQNGIENCGEFNNPTIVSGKQYYKETFKSE